MKPCWYVHKNTPLRNSVPCCPICTTSLLFLAVSQNQERAMPTQNRSRICADSCRAYPRYSVVERGRSTHSPPWCWRENCNFFRSRMTIGRWSPVATADRSAGRPCAMRRSAHGTLLAAQFGCLRPDALELSHLLGHRASVPVGLPFGRLVRGVSRCGRPVLLPRVVLWVPVGRIFLLKMGVLPPLVVPYVPLGDLCHASAVFFSRTSSCVPVQ